MVRNPRSLGTGSCFRSYGFLCWYRRWLFRGGLFGPHPPEVPFLARFADFHQCAICIRARNHYLPCIVATAIRRENLQYGGLHLLCPRLGPLWYVTTQRVNRHNKPLVTCQLLRPLPMQGDARDARAVECGPRLGRSQDRCWEGG